MSTGPTEQTSLPPVPSGGVPRPSALRPVTGAPVPASPSQPPSDTVPSAPASGAAEQPGLATWDEVLAADLGTRPASGMPWHSVAAGGAPSASSVEREGWSPLSRWDDAPSVPAPARALAGPTGRPDGTTHPPSGDGPSGPSAPAAPVRRHRRVWVVVLVVAALVTALGGGGVYLLTRDDGATGARAADGPVLVAADLRAGEQGPRTTTDEDSLEGLPETRSPLV